IKNVGAAAMAALVAERAGKGAYKDIHDFTARVDASVLNRRQFEHLIMAGCFDSLNPNRHQLFESIDALMAPAHGATQDRNSSQISLFGEASPAPASGQPLKAVEEWPVIEKLNFERAAIGYYLSAHPLAPYEALLRKLGVTSSPRLQQPINDRQSIKL